MTLPEFLIEYWYLVLAVIVTGFLFFRNIMDIAPKGSIGSGEATNLINRQHGVVIDVRSPQEFAAGHIVNAVNMPLDALESRLNELKKYKTKPLIVVCEHGKRAMKARQILSTAAGGEVYCLKGGLTQWKADGLPTVS